MEEGVSASFLDKTDWRITLHRKLEACVDAEGTYHYNNCVKSLISAASAEYPGWDAKKEITKEIQRLAQQYDNNWNEWLNKNLTKRRTQKQAHERYLEYEYYNGIFEYIKNMCARKRMLLWGSKKIGGGSPLIHDNEE